MRRAILIELAKWAQPDLAADRIDHPIGLYGLSLAMRHDYGLMTEGDRRLLRRRIAYALGWLSRERMVMRVETILGGHMEPNATWDG